VNAPEPDRVAADQRPGPQPARPAVRPGGRAIRNEARHRAGHAAGASPLRGQPGSRASRAARPAARARPGRPAGSKHRQTGPTGVADDARAALAAVRMRSPRRVGQEPVVTGLLIALVCQATALARGVPGVAKTLLIRGAGQRLGRWTGKRLPFTPDLMPGGRHRLADLRRAHLGVRFPARPGISPTCCSPMRSTGRRPRPRRHCWSVRNARSPVDARHGRLPVPLMVAPREPVEYEGTTRLPEAQLTGSC